MKNKWLVFIMILISFFMTSCRDDFKTKRELRAVWMSRFDYTSADKNPERMKNFILNSMRNVRSAKMNVVFFQIRGNADAFYKSDYEPWSAMLTGTLGKDPGWDPLQYAIETAHSLGLELHVWINTFPVWKAKEKLPEESIPRHILLEHPDWVICDKNGNHMQPDEGYISISPGIPDAKKHISNVVMDIVRKYDIDGFHFDYIRYPEESIRNGYSGDKVSKERFNSDKDNPKRLKWEDWQRDQINQFVKDISDSIKKEKQYVKISAAVIGNYSQGNWNGFNSAYQDGAAWLKKKNLDFVVPMSYFKMGLFSESMKNWKNITDTKNVYPGLAAYKGNDWGWDEIWNEINFIRENGFQGFVFFAVSSLNKVWAQIKDKQISGWANIPEIKINKTSMPEKVTGITVDRIDDNKVKIEWEISDGNKGCYYNIYRSKNGRFTSAEEKELIYITPRNEFSFIDETKEDYSYAVSALNRYDTEGVISEPVIRNKKKLTIMDKNNDNSRRD